MKQRATDIGDIKTRMLRLLLGVESVDMASLPKGTVLAAKDLTPSMTVGLQKENVSAIITEVGGKTSHSAILARALEIPAVLGIPDALQQLVIQSLRLHKIPDFHNRLRLRIQIPIHLRHFLNF